MHTARKAVAHHVAASVLAAVLLVLSGCGPSGQPANSSIESVRSAASEPSAPQATVASRAAAAVSEQAPADEPAAESTPPVRTVSQRAAGGITDITFDDLKFDIELQQPFERKMLTPEIEKLVGTRIRIRGFMGPTYQAEGIKTFPLYRNTECPFLGPKCPVYDVLVIDMQGDATASYSSGAVMVEGTLRIKEVLGYDDKPIAVYQIQADVAK